MDLALWITRAQAGDKHAFDRLVNAYQDKAVACALSRLNHRAAAEDAAQDAFLQAWRDLPTLTTPAAFPAWLRALVVKFCDRQTRRATVPVVPLENTWFLLPNCDGPHKQVEMRERRTLLLSLLARLPDNERTVLIAFYFGESSVSELAAFLSLSPATTRKRLQRARTRLRLLIQTQNKEEVGMILGENLKEMAPSRDTRFVERARLLRTLHDVLAGDSRVVALWTANDEGHNADDPWNSTWVQVIVRDDALEGFVAQRHREVRRLGEPLLFVEAPQNAPDGGGYLMTVYDGEAGPYEVNWFWQSASGATLPQGVRVAFDHLGLPSANIPVTFNVGTVPHAVYEQERAARSSAAKEAEEQRNCISLFLAMTMISAKCLARDPEQSDLPFQAMLANLERGVCAFVGLPSHTAVAKETATRAGKIAALQHGLNQMEAVIVATAQKGLPAPAAALPAARRFVEIVAAEIR